MQKLGQYIIMYLFLLYNQQRCLCFCLYLLLYYFYHCFTTEIIHLTCFTNKANYADDVNFYRDMLRILNNKNKAQLHFQIQRIQNRLSSTAEISLGRDLLIKKQIQVVVNEYLNMILNVKIQIQDFVRLFYNLNIPCIVFLFLSHVYKYRYIMLH